MRAVPGQNNLRSGRSGLLLVIREYYCLAYLRPYRTRAAAELGRFPAQLTAERRPPGPPAARYAAQAEARRRAPAQPPQQPERARRREIRLLS